MTNSEIISVLKGNDINKAIAILPNVLKDYSTNGKIRFAWKTISDNFNWNHSIAGFELSQDGKRVLVNIYWQGDSVDGNDYEYVEDIVRGKRIPSEWSGHYERHSALNISAEELPMALKALADYIEPSAVKEREEKARVATMKADLEKRAYRLYIDEMYAKYRFEYDYNMQKYFNGRSAVLSLLASDYEKFYAMDDSELFAIIEKVFKQNEKHDSDIPTTEDYKRVYNYSY